MAASLRRLDLGNPAKRVWRNISIAGETVPVLFIPNREGALTPRAALVKIRKREAEPGTIPWDHTVFRAELPDKKIMVYHQVRPLGEEELKLARIRGIRLNQLLRRR